jgi:hypothetical protein
VTQTEKIAQIHKHAKDAAVHWQEHFKPVTYRTPFFVGGDWVRVTIELIDAKDAMPTEPKRRVGDRDADAESERSQDA